MSAIETAIKNWRRTGVSLLPPNGEAAVITALSRMGRKYSRDIVALYCATGGMPEAETDSRDWSLWPLDKVVSENSEYDRPHILFADFLINSHLYCLKYETDERSSVRLDYFNGDEPREVAASVNEFFEIYLRTPGDLEIFE
ncbi:MAG: hypothetical protein ABJC10_09515, partial [Acidobacteriota bacterium]